MPHTDSEWLDRARQAQEKLVQKYIHHPDVSLIDIGLVPDPEGGEQVAVRVHIRHLSAEKSLQLPKEVDGIPVHVVIGDYRPE